MFKNNVFRPSVNTTKWIKGSATRALKTFAQTLGGSITIGMALNEVNWRYALSVACVSAIYSIITSVAGIPEVESNA